MKRRTFVIGAGAFSAYASRLQLSPSGGVSVSVVDYGADPSGKQDSTIGIRNAIRAMRVKAARVLVFPRGTYRLLSVQEVAMDFNNFSDLEVNGNGSTLLMGGDARCIGLQGCSNVTVHDLTVDYDPLPFTQGTVTESGLGWFTVKMDPHYSAPPNVELLAFGTVERATKKYTKNALDIYSNTISNVQSVGEGNLKVQLKRPITVPAGAVLVLRFKGKHEAFDIKNCKTVAVRNFNLHSSYSLGFSISRCTDLTFENTTVSFPTGSDRLLSTNADAMHITTCTGSLAIRKCTFQGMGDDAINITTGMLRLQKQPGSKSFLAVNGSGVPLNLSQQPPIRPGDRLEILDPHDLHLIATGKAIAGASDTVEGQIEGGASEAGDALVVDADLTPTTEISDCDFKGNRARAIVAHNNLQVRGCTFQNTTGPAILIAPDSQWMEGPLTRNIVIESNRFTGCHYASSAPEGSITIDVMHTFTQRPAKLPRGEASNILIDKNSFVTCPTAAITCRSADQLVIANNQCGPTWTAGQTQSPPKAILVSELTNSKVVNNTSTVPNAIVITDSDQVSVSGNNGFTILR